ncbi:dihydroneopterin aldolase [Ferruginibacter sp. SUN002]|uniref:dihydroneopterin aldolase n=1 Tax=Ferruginibacter sp. SUN002 TaxID=2937789 RepID=UPI003D35A2E6
MLSIHLNKLKFHSFHGMHEEEKVLGNELELNITVLVRNEEKIVSLKQTVNYVTLYEIIKQRMDKPTPLLETVAQDLADLITAFDNRISSVDINIKKLNPPIHNFHGQISVSYKKEM